MKSVRVSGNEVTMLADDLLGAKGLNVEVHGNGMEG